MFRKIGCIKGGGGGFRPLILETFILRYELKGKGEGQDTSRHFEGGFGSMRTILPSEQK